MTNHHFTTTEFRTLHNKDFFLVKASATEKIDALLAYILDEIKSEIKKYKEDLNIFSSQKNL